MEQAPRIEIWEVVTVAIAQNELDPNSADRFKDAQVVDWAGTNLRPDLAFPKLSEEAHRKAETIRS